MHSQVQIPWLYLTFLTMENTCCSPLPTETSVSLEKPIRQVRHDLYIHAGCSQFSCPSCAWALLSPAQLQPWASATSLGMGMDRDVGPRVGPAECGSRKGPRPGRAGLRGAGDRPSCGVAGAGAGGGPGLRAGGTGSGAAGSSSCCVNENSRMSRHW